MFCHLNQLDVWRFCRSIFEFSGCGRWISSWAFVFCMFWSWGGGPNHIGKWSLTVRFSLPTRVLHLLRRCVVLSGSPWLWLFATISELVLHLLLGLQLFKFSVIFLESNIGGICKLTVPPSFLLLKQNIRSNMFDKFISQKLPFLFSNLVIFFSKKINLVTLCNKHT